MNNIGPSLFMFLLCVLGSAFGCVTNYKIHDESRPQESWGIGCRGQAISEVQSWVKVECTFANQTREALVFSPIQGLEDKSERWRQADEEELKELLDQLKARRSNPRFLLPLQNNGSSLEAFIAQVLVNSAILVVGQSPSESDPIKEKASADPVTVKSGGVVRQVFFFIQDENSWPKLLHVTDQGILNGKIVALESDPASVRQRGLDLK